MGRSPSRGEPTKVASAPRAQATGSMKRSVEPDSPQSRVAPARSAQDAVFEAFEHGVDLKAALDGVDLGADRGKAADRRVDIGARCVTGDAGHAVGEGRRDDDAMRHRFGRDGRDGAGEGLGIDLG